MTRPDEGLSTGQRWIRGLRLAGAFVVVPLVLVGWQWLAIKIVGDQLDIDLVDEQGEPIFGFVLFQIGLAVPALGTLCVGIPYTLFQLSAGRMNFKRTMLASAVLAVPYAMIAYGYLQPQGYSTLAIIVAALSLVGFVVAALCFYVVGLWKRPTSPVTDR